MERGLTALHSFYAFVAALLAVLAFRMPEVEVRRLVFFGAVIVIDLLFNAFSGSIFGWIGYGAASTLTIISGISVPMAGGAAAIFVLRPIGGSIYNKVVGNGGVGGDRLGGALEVDALTDMGDEPEGWDSAEGQGDEEDEEEADDEEDADESGQA
jgi:hypothetical protein